MEELIKRALNAAGYVAAPTMDNLQECFADYAAAGVWRNLDPMDEEEIAEISLEDMCRALIRLS